MNALLICMHHINAFAHISTGFGRIQNRHSSDGNIYASDKESRIVFYTLDRKVKLWKAAELNKSEVV